jgi:DNA polymerase III epsilon subunit family exonuclease
MTAFAPSFRQKTLLLTQRLEELLHERRTMTAEEACEALLQSSRVPSPLARRIVQELVAGDRRFLLSQDGCVCLGAAPSLPAVRLREARFAVLDLETTGGSPSGDRILEIGAVLVEEGRLGATFSTLVNPGVPIPDFVSSMTGIREEMIREAPAFSAVAEELARFIGDSVLVAHNLPFDLGFLNQELERNCGFVLANPSLCTVKLGRRLLPQLPDRRLDTLAEYFGFQFTERHRALGDAEVTARLLVRFIGLLEEKEVEDLRGVERFLSTDQSPGDSGGLRGPRRRARRTPAPSSSDES